MCRHRQLKLYFGLWQKNSKSMVDSNFYDLFLDMNYYCYKIWKLFTQHQSSYNMVEVQNVSKERFRNLYHDFLMARKNLKFFEFFKKYLLYISIKDNKNKSLNIFFLTKHFYNSVCFSHLKLLYITRNKCSNFYG